MSLSVADYLLESESDKVREPETSAGAPSWPEPEATEAGSAAARAAGGRGARSTASPEFKELTRLLLEATREWSQVERAIEELRAALAPARFPEALTAAGIEPPRSVPGKEKERAGHAVGNRPPVPGPRQTAAPHARAADAPTSYSRIASRAPPARGSKPEPAAASRKRETANPPPAARAPGPEPSTGPRPGDRAPSPPLAARPQAAAPTPAGARGAAGPVAAAAGPEADGAVHAKLEQVLKLLRESLAGRAGGTNAIPPEVSQKLAHAIAREVAGQVKETVISNLPRQGGAPHDSGASDPGGEQTGGADRPDEESKRIPLGDVAAIIDQLIKRR